MTMESHHLFFWKLRSITYSIKVSAPDTIGKMSSILQTSKSMRKRRHRIPYSQEEVDNLLEGVENLGKFWCQILSTYKFHPSRTAVDLMEKFKRLSVRILVNKCPVVAFLLCNILIDNYEN